MDANCTVVGQVIEPLPTNEGIRIYSVAGLRRTAAGKEVASLTEAKPFLIEDNTETYRFGSGITIKSIKLGGPTPYTDVDSIGVFTTFNSYSTGPVPILGGGGSRSNLYATNGSHAASIQNKLREAPPGQFVRNPTVPIEICLTDGVRDGLIELNSGSSLVTIRNC
jgi:hypothetical protein